MQSIIWFLKDRGKKKKPEQACYINWKQNIWNKNYTFLPKLHFKNES